jgi:hypothetical protein
MSLIAQAYKAYQNQNLSYVYQRAQVHIKNIYDSKKNMIKFIFSDFLQSNSGNSILLAVRGSTLGPDSLPLLTQIAEEQPNTTVYLVVDSITELNRSEMHNISDISLDLNIVERWTSGHISAAIDSMILISCQSTKDIAPFGRYGNNERLLIYIYHGITITGGRNLTENKTRELDTRNIELNTKKSRCDIRVVESDEELHARVSSSGLHPACFSSWGYPRYDRIDDLQNNVSDVRLPEEKVNKLSNENTTKFLYAPTSWGKPYEDLTEFFPFEQFDADDFKQFLEEMGIEIYLRTHYSEENSELYDRFIDGNTIHYAGRSFSSSVIEILPFFDGLITDYSAIYMDYLPFDLPILFIKSKKKRDALEFNFKLPYEKYSPGNKVLTYKRFKNCIADIHQKRDDGFKQERDFVKKSLLSEHNEKFIQKVIEEYDSKY